MAIIIFAWTSNTNPLFESVVHFVFEQNIENRGSFVGGPEDRKSRGDPLEGLPFGKSFGCVWVDQSPSNVIWYFAVPHAQQSGNISSECTPSVEAAETEARIDFNHTSYDTLSTFPKRFFDLRRHVHFSSAFRHLYSGPFYTHLDTLNRV